MIQLVSKRQRKMEYRIETARKKKERKRHAFLSRRFSDYAGFYGESVASPSSMKDMETANIMVRRIYPKLDTFAGYDIYNVKILDTDAYHNNRTIMTAAMGTSSLVDHGVLWFIKKEK